MVTAANIRLGAGTAPTVPAGEGALYFSDSDDQLYVIDAGGNTVGPVGGGGTPTLQDVYDQSSPPNVVVDSSKGGLFLDNPDLSDKAVPLAVRTLSNDGDAVGVLVGTAGNAGVGVNVTMNTGTNGAGIHVQADGNGPGVNVDHNPATNNGIVVNGPTTVCSVNSNAVGVTGPSLSSTLSDAAVTTPRVIFADGGTSRVEVIGDPGAGDHYNPRVRETSGSVDLGAVARCSSVVISAGGANVGLTTEPSKPTFVQIDPGIPISPPLLVTLPSSADYPPGTEITLINIDSAAVSFDIDSVGAPLSSRIINVVGAPQPNVTVGAGTGIKFVCRGATGWIQVLTF